MNIVLMEKKKTPTTTAQTVGCHTLGYPGLLDPVLVPGSKYIALKITLSCNLYILPCLALPVEYPPDPDSNNLLPKYSVSVSLCAPLPDVQRCSIKLPRLPSPLQCGAYIQYRILGRRRGTRVYCCR